MISNEEDGSSLLKRKHFRGLDGLRGIAVAVVMVHHFYRAAPTRFLRVFEEGWAGVDLFFVLSGFLITGILLDGKARGVPLRFFYARRALRIFPLYYFVLCLIFLVPFVLRSLGYQANSPSHTFWLWSYLTNIPATFTGLNRPDTAPLYVAHFWSLAIEEQFYLIWPWVTLALTESQLRALALFCLPLSLGAKALLLRAGVPAINADWFTLVRMDGLCVGAVLACTVRRSDSVSLFRLRSVYGALFMAALCAFSFWARPLFPYPTKLANHLMLSLFFGAVLAVVVSSPDRAWINRILGLRPLVWLGQRSYGLYVWHFLLLGVAVRAVRGWGIISPGETGELALVAALFLLSCAAASVSWFVIEERFILAKRNFEFASGRLSIQPASSRAR